MDFPLIISAESAIYINMITDSRCLALVILSAAAFQAERRISAQTEHWVIPRRVARALLPAKAALQGRGFSRAESAPQ
jgi:hypothetical protein